MKNSTLSVAFFSFLITATSGSLAFAKEQEDPRKGEKVDRICFARTIDGFNTNTKRSVVLSAGPSKDYLVETGYCLQLRHAKRIGLDSSGGCLRRGDRLIVSEDMFPNGATLPADRCVVKAIYKWNKNAEADVENETETDESTSDDTVTEK